MNDKIFKYIKILLYVLLGLGVATLIYFLVMSMVYTSPSPDYPIGTVGAAKGAQVLLLYTYVLFAIALIAALAFPLVNIIKNPKGAKKSLIGVGAMILILLVSYLISSDAPVVNSAGGFFTGSAELKLADMGLYTTYIMLFGAFLLIIGTEIWGSFRKK